MSELIATMEVKSLMQVSMEMWGILICLSMVACTFVKAKVLNRKSVLLLGLELGVTLLVIADMFAIIFRGNPTEAGFLVVRIANFGYFLMQLIIALLFIHYLYEVSEIFKTGHLLNIAKYGVAVGMLLLVINLWSGFMYRFDANNTYIRGPWLVISPLIVAAIMILIIVEVSRRYKVLTALALTGIYLFWAFVFMAGVAQYFMYGFSFVVFGAIIGLMIMFFCMEIDESIQFTEKESKMAIMNTNVMLSQIQPHFMYNTITAIQYLCQNDAQMAEKALGDFASYIRFNMDSMKMDENIPFSKELEHVKKYVYFEKLRFEDRVQVEYDIQYDNFMLPPLTIQPMVENAIKHGITKKRKGGCVRISTKREDNEVVIIIADDGKGVEKQQFIERLSDGRSHIGVYSVQKRIEALKGGSFCMASEPNVGTTITMRFAIKQSEAVEN